MVAGLFRGFARECRPAMSMNRTIKLYSKTAVARPPVKVFRKNPQRAAALTDTEDTLYRELLDGIYDGVLVTDIAGRIVDANPRALDFLQFSKDELTEMKVGAVVSGIGEALLGTIRENIEKQKFTLLEAYCIRKDTSNFPVEITVNIVHLTAEGEICFFIRNITRRKQVENRLRTQNSALQNSASGVVVAGTDARVTFANLSFLRLWAYEKRAEVIGRDIRSFFKNEEEGREMVRALHENRPWTGEAVGTRADSSEFYAQVSAAPNRDSDDKVIGMVFSFVDITVRKKAEDALRKEAQELLERARYQKDFSGLLNIISISDVIQLINASQKSGTLEIRKFPFRLIASLVFDKGEIIDASCNNVIGVEAVHETIRARGEEFHFEQGRVTEPKQRIQQKTMAMLMEGCRLLDEEVLPAESEGLSKSILAIDDDPAVLETLERLLQKKGYHVFATSDSKDAFKVIKSHNIDLVVLDVQMPEKDGFEVYREIKEYQNIPVLFATGHPNAFAVGSQASVDLLQNEFITGKTDIIYKPFDFETLCEKVESLIGSSAPE